MNRNIIFIIILGLAIAMVVMNKGKEEIMIAPPVAEKTPHLTTVHGYDRVDNYHWMRLTDKQNGL